MEGCEDDGEEGCGEKLLFLLQRMGVENILIMVTIWDDQGKGRLGVDVGRLVVGRAKELLTQLHEKVSAAERESTDKEITAHITKPLLKTAVVGEDLISSTNILNSYISINNSTIGMEDSILSHAVITKAFPKKDDRKDNTKTNSVIRKSANTKVKNEHDFLDAVEMAENSLKSLTK